MGTPEAEKGQSVTGIKVRPLFEEPTKAQIRMRRRLSRLLKYPLNATSIDRGSGREDATRAAENGFGIVILFPHPEEVSSFILADQAIARNNLLSERLSVFPVALHQEGKVLDWLEEHAAFEYPKLVTKNTRDDKKYKDVKGDSGKEFMRRSRHALEHAGTVSIAFQGGRSDHLDVRKGKATIGTFIHNLNKGKKPGDNDYFTKFGFLFVGYGEPGREDYYQGAGGGGLRLFKRKELVFGPFMTYEELMKMADGKEGKVDQVVRDIEATLVPPEYLKPPTEEAKKRHKRNHRRKKVTLFTAAVTGAYTAGVHSGKKGR